MARQYQQAQELVKFATLVCKKGMRPRRPELSFMCFLHLHRSRAFHLFDFTFINYIITISTKTLAFTGSQVL